MDNSKCFYGSVLFILISILLLELNSNQELEFDELDMCSIENSTFQTGEKLTYKIYYNLGPIWWPAGEVEFYVEENGNDYIISALGRTYKNYEKIYKVHDRYYSKLDKKRLLPSHFLRDIQEGDYYRYDSIEFDQSKFTLASYWGRSRESLEKFEYQMDGCIQDLISIIYYVRNVPFEKYNPNTKFPVKVFFDKELYDLDVLYLGIERNKKIKSLGRFNTLNIMPDMVEGHVFNKGTKMKVWISNDANKLPLIIESPIVLGSVKGVLKEFKGIKYPMSSKIMN